MTKTFHHTHTHLHHGRRLYQTPRLNISCIRRRSAERRRRPMPRPHPNQLSSCTHTHTRPRAHMLPVCNRRNWTNDKARARRDPPAEQIWDQPAPGSDQRTRPTSQRRVADRTLTTRCTAQATTEAGDGGEEAAVSQRGGHLCWAESTSVAPQTPAQESARRSS